MGERGQSHKPTSSPAASEVIPPAPSGDPFVLEPEFLNRTLAPYVGQTSVHQLAFVCINPPAVICKTGS